MGRLAIAPGGPCRSKEYTGAGIFRVSSRPRAGGFLRSPLS